MPNPFGHFDHEQHEYVITDPMTPEPWINYLDGEGKLNAFVSAGGGGALWYDQPHTGRLTRYRFNGLPMDTPGFYVYLRDGDVTWNPSFFPAMTPLDHWQCRHGMAYTRFQARLGDLQADLTLLIAPQDDVLLWDLTLTNLGSDEKTVHVHPYVDYALHEIYKDNNYFLVCGNQARYYHDPQTHALVSEYFSFGAPFMGHTRLSASMDFERFDLNRNHFIGRGRTEANPLGLERGHTNTQMRDGGFHACGTFELPITLAPGQQQRVAISLAAAADAATARELSLRYRDLAQVDAARQKLGQRWRGVLDLAQVNSADENVNAMLNVWLVRNSRATMRCGRSISHRHTGVLSSLRFRDTMQDIMPGCLYFPEETRRTILTLMRCVRESGRVVTEIDPATGLSPDPAHTRGDAIFWGVMTLHRYLCETGDQELLTTEVPAYDQGQATVLEHLVRGMRFVGTNTGRHGLPLMHDCDWNDMLQVFTCGQPGGESVMMAAQFIYTAELLTQLLELAGQREPIDWLHSRREDFARIMASEACWDGAWYKRMLLPGAQIGSSVCPEGRIFLNAQSWAAIAGILPPDQVRTAMDSAAEQLDTDCGLRLFRPPYTRMIDGVTLFATNTPGAGENGGLFLHANTWAVMAEAMLGNPQRAWKYYRQILPARLSERDPHHYAREPYAFASWIYGPDHEAFGHAALTWLTGGAAWMLEVGMSHLLGIRPTLHGLQIAPCLDPAWPSCQVERTFRGARYRVTINNPDGVGSGRVSLRVDGQPIEGDVIPLASPGTTVDVEAIIQRH